MNKEPKRLSGNLADGTGCVLYLDSTGARLEVDRDHRDPRDMFAPPDEVERLVVTLSDSKVATLAGAYRTRRTSNFVRSFEEYRANLTYVGPGEFLPEQPVVELTFRPSNELLAVMYNQHRFHGAVDTEDAALASIIRGDTRGRRLIVDIIDTKRLCAFSATAEGLTLAGHVRLSTLSDMHGQHTTETREVRIQYDEPITIAHAIPDMITTCDFMSLMVGTVISPAELLVVADGEADRLGRLPTFEVYATWREAGKDIHPKDGRQCLAAPLFDPRGYEQAVARWIKRREDWRTSYALGTACLPHYREISSRRFLDAAAWFESIPTAIYERERERVGTDVLAEAAAAASAAFQRHGADVSDSRARALLGPVNAASLNTRIQDAIWHARTINGADIFPPSVDRLARIVSRIRGRFAHGEDAFASDLGHLVYHATLLLETLACLLTLADLGVRLTAGHRGHPLNRALLELQNFDGC